MIAPARRTPQLGAMVPRLAQMSTTLHHLVQPLSQVTLTSMSMKRQTVPMQACANPMEGVVRVRGWHTQLPADLRDKRSHGPGIVWGSG